MLERLLYIHLRIAAELRNMQHVLQWVKHRYVKTFAVVTGATHCLYFGLVSTTGHGLYIYPAAILMSITLFTLLSGEGE
jgi:hypothetical protein